MPSSVTPSAVATPEKPASLSGDPSSFHPIMAQPVNSVLASTTLLPPPLPYPAATNSFSNNYVVPSNSHLYAQTPVTSTSKQVFTSAAESSLHHPTANYSKIALTQHRSVGLSMHAASNNYVTPIRGSSPPLLDHLSTSTVGASSDATGIATTPTTATTPPISRPYTTTFAEDPNVSISHPAAAESQLAVSNHGSAVAAAGRVSVDDAWTRDQRTDALKGGITAHAVTPVYDVEKLRREGCTVDLKLGQVFNHRGYAICGVLNQHDKPCQRIGRCPFHPFRSPVTQWNTFNSSLTDSSSKSRSAEALANSLASVAERRTPRRRVPYKRGWTKEEHFLFLKGLNIHGKGRWKAISSVVTSRTPTQIQSHAQKYFLRQKQRRKNKRSIHDLNLDSQEMKEIDKNTDLSAQAEASARRAEQAQFATQATINPFATVRPTSASLPVGASMHLSTQPSNLNSNVGGGDGYANRSAPVQNGSSTHGFQGNVSGGLSAGDPLTGTAAFTPTSSSPLQANVGSSSAQPSMYQTRTTPPIVSTYSLPLNYSLYSTPNSAIGHAYTEDRAISNSMAMSTTSMGVGTVGTSTNVFPDPAQQVGFSGHGLPPRDL